MKVIQTRIEDSIRCALLVTEGSKHLHLIPMDAAGLRIVQVPATHKYTEVEGKSIHDAKKQFIAAAKKFGCGQTVARHLGLDEAIVARPATQKETDMTEKAPKAEKAAKAPKAAKEPKPAKAVPAKADKPAKAPKAAKADKADSSPKNASKQVFVTVWNANPKAERDAMIAAMAKQWRTPAGDPLPMENATARFARISRELGAVEGKPVAA